MTETTLGRTEGFWQRVLARLRAGWAWFSGGGAREEEIGELVLLRRAVGNLAGEIRADRQDRQDEMAVLRPLADVLASAASGERWTRFRAAQAQRDAIVIELDRCSPRMRHKTDAEKDPIRRWQAQLFIDLEKAQAECDRLYRALQDDEQEGQGRG